MIAGIHEYIRFSIIIPTYNSSATLAQCLNSLTTQRFDNFEVLIIDNNSDDASGAIAAAYQRELNLKIFSEPDGGIYEAINKGVEIARGEYLYFLGSNDTLYHDNVLTTINDVLNNTAAPILYGNVMMKKAGESGGEGFIHAGEFDLKRLFSDNICHQAIFYHKSVFTRLGRFNVNYPVLADYDFNLRCSANYNFHYTNLIIANFVLGGRSSQQKDTVFDQEKLANILTYFFSKLHTKMFVGLRYYVKQGALSYTAQIGVWKRLYFLLVYAKLKVQSLLE